MVSGGLLRHRPDGDFLNQWLTQHIALEIFNQRCYVAAGFDRLMHGKLIHTDLQNLEDPSFFDTKEKANKFLYGDWHGFAYVLESAFSIAGKLLTLLGIFAIILSLNFWIVLVFLGMIALSTAVDARFKTRAHGYMLDAVEVERRWNYCSRILEDTGYTKEIRINHLGDWLMGKEHSYAEEAISYYKKRSRFFSLSNLSDALCTVLQSAVTYAYLIHAFVAGAMSIGSFTLYVNAVATFSGSVKEILGSLLDIKAYGIYYDELEKYVGIPETLRDNAHLPVPETEDFTITFRDVSFRYPGQEMDALSHVNLTLHSGEKLAVVGENGAGKTTLIKLLCRLCDPTEGEILLNGQSIRDMDYDAYLDLFSAVFQDFRLFALSVAENVVFSDENGAQRAEKLLQRVGLGEKLASLPKGVHTSVTKEFDESGFEPSGGQAQKIAIARALAKDAKVVILDEPLSALDPKAERDIYAQFQSLVAGKTAVYISHRMSATRFCDHVAVFSGGRLAEYGTHAQLMEQGGIYHELYQAQAQYYR